MNHVRDRDRPPFCLPRALEQRVGHGGLTVADCVISETSLIGVAGVKLFLFLLPDVAPVDHSLLFAVGAWPPHDGVRRTRRLNLSRDLRGITTLRFRTLSEITSPIVPAGTTSAPPF